MWHKGIKPAKLVLTMWDVLSLLIMFNCTAELYNDWIEPNAKLQTLHVTNTILNLVPYISNYS